jgi:signal transduction histidine kinase
MLDTGRLVPQGQPQPLQRRPSEPACTPPAHGARRAECLRRADAVGTLGVEVHLTVHDLRNSLSNAVLNAGLLARRLSGAAGDPDNSELLDSVRRDLKQVQDTLARMSQLTEDQSEAVEAVEVASLLTDVRRLAWAAAQLTGDVRVDVVAPQQPLFVRGVRRRLQQAIFALVRNAIEASPASDEVRIEVEARGDEVHIRVLDRGPGLAPELRERVFEEFESTKAAGLGIGLSVARLIIVEHAGSLTLLSPHGSGLCAEVRLPSSRAAAR